MGEIVATADGEVKRNIEQETNGGNRTDDKSSSTSNTRTTNGGTTNGGTTNGGTERTIPETTGELALLSDDERVEYQTADEKRKKAILKNARRRQQYAEKKASGGQSVKPRKVRGKQTEPQKAPIDKTSLNMMIMSLSAIVASRPNQEHWLLTEAEVNSITDPLSKMIAESEAFANIGQYSNQIALIMACGTVFIPRVIVSAQKQKEIKKHAVTGQHTNTTVGEIGNSKKATRSDSKPTGKNDSDIARNGSDNDSGQPWFGSAISY